MTAPITHDRAREIAIICEWFADVRDFGEGRMLPPSLAHALLEKLDSARLEPPRDARSVFVLERRWRVNGELKPGIEVCGITDPEPYDWRNTGRHPIFPSDEAECRVVEYVPREPAQAVDAEASLASQMALEYCATDPTCSSEFRAACSKAIAALRSRPAPASAASDRERERELVALLSELNRRELPHQISTCGPDLYCATVGDSGSGTVPFSSAFAALHAATANHDARKGTTP